MTEESLNCLGKTPVVRERLTKYVKGEEYR